MKTKKSFLLGYSLIIHSLLAWWISAGVTTSGMNVWIPAFVEKYGWDRSVMLSLSTVGGIISVIGTFVFASLVMKKGTRFVTVITYILAGISVICMGHVSTIAGYGACIIAGQILSNGYAGPTTNTLIGNWFPKTKATVLGITTMGMPLAAFAFVPILSKLIGSVGISGAFTAIGIFTILIGAASIFWVKDYPQQAGLYPDNREDCASEDKDAAKNYKSKWTIKKLLCNKNAWLITIAFGLLFLVTQGMVSQTVTYLVEYGFEQPAAVRTLSMASLIGIFGSLVWGLIDQKLSTKTASLLYAGWYVVLFLLLRLQINYVMVMAGVVMLGFAIGGIGNLMPSMIMTTYGVKEFASVNRVIFTFGTLIRSFAFVALAIGLKVFGTYAGSTIIFLVFAAIAFILILPIDKKDYSE